MNQTFTEYLLYLKKSNKVKSLKDLAQKSGYNYTYLSQVKNGIKVYTEEMQSKLFSIFGQPLVYNAEPIKSAEIYKPKIQGNVIYVPHEASAGFAQGNNNPLTNKELEVWTLPFLPYMAYAFKVSGESMKRTLRNDEMVFVEQQSLWDFSEFGNKIHVIETKSGEYLVKRVSRISKEEIRISSDNPDHKDKQVIYNLEQEISRIWKVKHCLKYDMGFMEDMEGLDTGIEEAAIRLDKKDQNDRLVRKTTKIKET